MSSKTKSAAKATGTKSSVKSRKEAARQRQQRNQMILIGIGAATIIAIVAIVAIVNSTPVTVVLPSGVINEYTEIAEKGYQGKTEDGYYFIGNPEAKVTMEMFSSFSCPACAQYKRSYFENIKDKITNGDVKFVYVPLTTYGGFNSDGMSRGAYCAGEQGRFWEMHDTMFDWQGRYAAGSNDYRRLTAAAEMLGLDTAKFGECLTASSTGDMIAKAADLAQARGVNSTPTVFFNGTKIYPEMADGSTSIPGPSELRGLIEAELAK